MQIIKARFVLAALLLTPLFVSAYASPGKPAGYVNDFAQIFSPEIISTLDQELQTFATQTGNEIAVVTIATHGSDETIETYAVKLFEEWGIGMGKEDSGILLLIARDDREMRIEVGYGLEPVVTDIQSGYIIRETLTPAFQAGDFDKGVMEAVRQLRELASTGILIESPTNTLGDIDWGSVIPFAVLILIYLGSILARSKSWWAGGILGAIIGFIFFGFLLGLVLAGVGFLFDFLVSRSYEKHKGRGTNPPWFMGGGGLGGGRGGFGGFGGGMSGGGGASGRW